MTRKESKIILWRLLATYIQLNWILTWLYVGGLPCSSEPKNDVKHSGMECTSLCRKKSTCCVFPFVYKNRTYSQCIRAVPVFSNIYWCATKVDVNSWEMLEWGRCSVIPCNKLNNNFLFGFVSLWKWTKLKVLVEMKINNFRPWIEKKNKKILNWNELNCIAPWIEWKKILNNFLMPSY